MDDHFKHGIEDDAGGIASQIETGINDLDLGNPAPTQQNHDKIEAANCPAADGIARVVALDIPAPVQQDFNRKDEAAKWMAATGGALVTALDELCAAEDRLRYEVVGQAFAVMLDSRLAEIRCPHRRERTRDDVLGAVFNPASPAHNGFIKDFEESLERYMSSARRAEERRSHTLVYECSLDKDERLRVDRGPPASSRVEVLGDWRNGDRLVDLLYLEQCIGRLPELESRIVFARIKGLKVHVIATQLGLPDHVVHAVLADFRGAIR